MTMTTFKGTKGKWIKEDTEVFSIQNMHLEIAQAYSSSEKSISEYTDKDWEEAHANAQLMATSPELLEDLQEAVELFDSAYKCMADGDNAALYNALVNATSRTRFKETIAKALTI